MASAGIEGEELKKMVMMGKKRPLSFAFCPGKKNDHVILIDRRKEPELIAKAAKKEGSGSKVAFGTFEVKSDTMELTCGQVIPALGKTLKKYLKSQKVIVKILVLDAEGNVLERDEEGQPDDTSPVAIADTPPVEATPAEPVSDAKDIARRLKAISPTISKATGTSAGSLKKAMALAVSQIKSGDLVAAEKTLAALEAAAEKLGQAEDATPAEPESTANSSAEEASALAAQAKALRDILDKTSEPARTKLTKALAAAIARIKSGDLAAADALLKKIGVAAKKTAETDRPFSPEAAKWADAETRLQPVIDKLMQEGRGDLDAINRFFNFAKEQAAAGNFDKALAAVARVAGLAKQAATETTTVAAREAQEAAPDNVTAYTKTRLDWIKTRSGLRKELEGLKSAIDKTTAGIEGLEDVPARSGSLLTNLDSIDSSLEDTLEKLVQTPDGDRREGLKTSARKIVGDYRAVLDTDFFQAVDNNGFLNTSIRANALGSLQAVSAALET